MYQIFWDGTIIMKTFNTKIKQAFHDFFWLSNGHFKFSHCLQGHLKFMSLVSNRILQKSTEEKILCPGISLIYLKNITYKFFRIFRVLTSELQKNCNKYEKTESYFKINLFSSVSQFKNWDTLVVILGKIRVKN